MEWVELEARHALRPHVALLLLEKAVQQQPDRAILRERLAGAYLRQHLYSRAVQEFETALSMDQDSFQSWADLLEALLRTGEAAKAIAAGERARAGGAETASLLVRIGEALCAVGRRTEARAIHEQAFALGDYQHFALQGLLAELARGDGNELLHFCENLPSELRHNALVRANLAIAYSRLGRWDEARELIDLKKHVARFRFAPPAEFGSLKDFNRVLTAEILQGTPPQVDFQQLYLPDTTSKPALAALLVFIREKMEEYLSQDWEARGLDRALPPKPTVATLYDVCTILRRGGRNGEHVHAKGYVSGVYHVSTPPTTDPAEGALALGVCETYTGGYKPCWGQRLVEPTPGCLTLFPSQVFHDVVPTMMSAPRVSVAADLRAVR